MKKSAPLLLLVLLSNVCCSQEYKRLRLTAGVGLFPLIFIEPSFRINDKFSVGVKWEHNFSGTFTFDEYKAWSMTSQYTLYKNEFVRHFIGFGIGYYSKANEIADTHNPYSSGYGNHCDVTYHNSQIGFFPRIGFDLDFFTVTLDANFIGPISYTSQCDRQPAIEGSTKMHFFALKAGFTIGGGKKNLKREMNLSH